MKMEPLDRESLVQKSRTLWHTWAMKKPMWLVSDTRAARLTVQERVEDSIRPGSKRYIPQALGPTGPTFGLMEPGLLGLLGEAPETGHLSESGFRCSTSQERLRDLNVRTP